LYNRFVFYREGTMLGNRQSPGGTVWRKAFMLIELRVILSAIAPLMFPLTPTSTQARRNRERR
jgi:hypothetical protein